MKKILVIGGDKRQKVMAETLRSEGICTDFLLSSDDLKKAALYSYIILPVPVSKDSVNIFSAEKGFNLPLDSLIEHLSASHTVFGGGFSPKMKKSLEDKGVNFYDFLEDENFVIGNAHLTAQGSLRLLLESTENYIVGSKALIIGFGRVASALSLTLKAVGIDVYIAARSSRQLQLAKCLGYKTVRLSNLGGFIYYFDYIFGTVPSKVLYSDDINLMRDDCIYFELASAPFGADKEDFIKHGKGYVFGGALPGKYLPAASGRLLCDYILHFISKQKE